MIKSDHAESKIKDVKQQLKELRDFAKVRYKTVV
jgi:hypothetical protein